MAMDTEEMIRAQPMDSVIVIGGCEQNSSGASHGRDQRPICRPWSSRGPMVVGHHKAKCSAPAPIAAGCGQVSPG